MSKLVLLRHGQSQWNLENRFTGWKDIELSENGILEAKESGRLIKEKKIPIDAVYSSELKRANDTAIIAMTEANYDHLFNNGKLIMTKKILDGNFSSCIEIYSKKGTTRANHYHKEDWHYCYLINGAIDYYFREVGDSSQPKMVTIKPGQVFYTPSMVEHAMYFSEDSVFLTLGGDTRSSEDYEADLVRVNLI